MAQYQKANISIFVYAALDAHWSRGSFYILYWRTKNHVFSDVNKKIADTMFVYFLNKMEFCLKAGRN